MTQKFQARYIVGASPVELVTSVDTSALSPFVSAGFDVRATIPTQHPTQNQLLPIATVFARLSMLVGTQFVDAGFDQERNRGAELHRQVCLALGYAGYQDDGQFPDVRHQLLEIKLQTSPTIDLGLVCPNSTDALDVPQLSGTQIRHCDVRYAVFYGVTDGRQVTLTALVLTTGEAFFTRFQQFQGKVLNRKLQIPLPARFFTS